jgi:hypothetical protein
LFSSRRVERESMAMKGKKKAKKKTQRVRPAEEKKVAPLAGTSAGSVMPDSHGMHTGLTSDSLLVHFSCADHVQVISLALVRVIAQRRRRQRGLHWQRRGRWLLLLEFALVWSRPRTVPRTGSHC